MACISASHNFFTCPDWKELRDPLEDRVFWIDAICINQEDDKEKSRQVPMMAQIYSEAANVRI
jgi:Heterokaryon incompatibility protein (HET)